MANYKLQGRMEIQGIQISIENRKGSIRSGVDSDGHPWKVKMAFPYGRIIGVPRTGGDHEHVDVYVGPNRSSEKVFIIHINKADTGAFDEDKVFLSFNSKQEAKQAFDKQYDSAGRKLYGSMTEMDITTFKQRLNVQGAGMIKSLKMTEADQKMSIQHVLSLENLSKAHVKQYFRRTATGRVVPVKAHEDDRQASGKEQKGTDHTSVWQDASEIVRKTLKKNDGDKEKSLDDIINAFRHGFVFEDRKKNILRFCTELFPDMDKEDSKKKILDRARELRVLAKSLIESQSDYNSLLLVVRL